MDTSFIFYLIAGLLVAVGVAGVILPALPGLPLVFAGLLLAAWTNDFQRVGWLVLTVLGLLTLLSIIVDVVSSALGAKGVGASRKAMIGAVIGTLAGFHARRILVARNGGHDLPVALAEDVLAVGGGFAIAAVALSAIGPYVVV